MRFRFCRVEYFWRRFLVALVYLRRQIRQTPASPAKRTVSVHENSGRPRPRRAIPPRESYRELKNLQSCHARHAKPDRIGAIARLEKNAHQECRTRNTQARSSRSETKRAAQPSVRTSCDASVIFLKMNAPGPDQDPAEKFRTRLGGSLLISGFIKGVCRRRMRSLFLRRGI